MKSNFYSKLSFTILLIGTLFLSCSVEQLDSRIDEDASNLNRPFTCSTGVCGARLTNNGTLSVDLAIYDHDDVLLFEALNIVPGSATSWQNFPIGILSYTVTTPATTLFKTVVIDMQECMVYDMEVAPNDMLVTDQPTLLD